MRVILCDDHGLLLAALRCALEGGGHRIVAVTTDPEECVDLVAHHGPEVCLLDLSFPGVTGLSVLPRLRAVSPSTAVLVLSGRPGHAVVGEAMSLGAAGFLRKDQPLSGILAALEHVGSGKAWVGVPPRHSPEHRRPAVSGVAWLVGFLTEREREVLQHILDGRTTGEMARQMGVAPSTARTHVQKVLQKLGVHSRLQAAARVTGIDLPALDRPA